MAGKQDCRPVPCVRGCGRDAWEIEPDGRLHFAACRYGDAIEGARPVMGFLYDVWRAIKRAWPCMSADTATNARSKDGG